MKNPDRVFDTSIADEMRNSYAAYVDSHRTDVPDFKLPNLFPREIVVPAAIA